ncbi:ABC transporter ATP-binding protein [Williamsia deligens]|uniref:ABC transporter ATP-binding protein n=1 Tax=Williamsia deligens TaxID=321325 RepID=A0ABW3G5I5_9NOCA|nr:ABC transporter ATP-binding protein [Williamsia deligens]MCP2194965.1 thiamine transport system ATP-binding protein [Williamsia deligens]
MLEITGLRVTYGGVAVLDGLDLTVGSADAPVTALIGPSGCGKSTLVRAVAGLEPVDAGTIRVDGTDLAGVPTHRRDFGVVFQDGQLLPGRSVASNVGYGLRARRWSRSATATRVAEMLELVGLPGLGDRPVSQLSGGQAQRVALARALAPRPRLLLLDEPLSALDRRLRERLAVDIADILHTTATPAILVTHDHTEAAVIADRVAVMADGVVAQQGPPDVVWRRPATEEIARFVGCTTVLEAPVVDGVAQTPLGPVDVGWSGARPRCTLGLRARSVIVEGEDHRQGGVSVRVESVATLPEDRHVWVRTVDGLRVAAVADHPVAIGDDVTVEVDPARVAVVGAQVVGT